MTPPPEDLCSGVTNEVRGHLLGVRQELLKIGEEIVSPFDVADLEIVRLGHEGPAENLLIFVPHGVEEGQRVVIHEDQDGLSVVVEIALELLKSQNQSWAFFFNGGVAQLVTFQLG